ncbi:lytic transglycosylase domain-containing protein [Hamadaea sp. NPDC050747]|uniref:aggregation-promoting factor C-terminal-like domain-containing protein n=1 Tax=Hamadaea sp. NPDC050747 TaxID=3155789 RepID=UPI003406FBF0
MPYPRKIMVGLLGAALFAAGGLGLALTQDSADDEAVASMQADRAAGEAADRSLDRLTESPSASPSLSPSTSPTPAAKPSPTRTATRTATPKKTATIPAACTAYSGNKLIACKLLPAYGFAYSQMTPLVKLWNRESGWDETAENSSSGAYGIPQALPGNKMATAGSDWRTNPATQIKWGLGYIKSVYGSPSAAWAHSQSTGWY